jgi:hypothetical protein|tara:strand:+ start:90 stop:566 length:477 start_codon:yes stop_codon:yes gene_type:complete
MAIFSGNIIEAYYANAENDAVEVIYKQGNKAINHYLKVDFNNQDFKDLIAEYDTDKIAGSTIARNRNYARQLSEMVDMGIRAKTDKKDKVKVTIDDFIDSIIDYKSANQQSAEMLFALKVKLFEHEKVKSCTDKELKSSLRTAKNPITAIKIFDKING